MMRTVVGTAVCGILLCATAAAAKIGGGDIVFTPKGAGVVIYSHDQHAGKVGIKCSECHFRVFNTKEERKSMTMAQMQKGLSCGYCHNGERAFSVKDANTCNKCHA